MATRELRICEVCKREYMSKNAAQRICSHECLAQNPRRSGPKTWSAARRAAAVKTRVCAMCGAEFAAQGPRKYCTPSCRNKAAWITRKSRPNSSQRNREAHRAEVNRLLALQGGVCAICKLGKWATKQYWHLDHDHMTGKNRGALCSRCNLGLGLFQDRPESLRAAADYLERSMA